MHTQSRLPNFLKLMDWGILILACTIFGLGLVILYSASFQKTLEMNIHFPLRQLGWFIMSLVGFILVATYSYRKLIHFSYPLYTLNLLILFLTLLLGLVRFGAQRWLALGGFIFQPSEITKLIVIMALAQYMGHHQEKLSRFVGILVPMMLVFIPAILIALQPDLGTALVLIPMLFAMLFVAGAPLRLITIWIFLGCVASPILWHFLKDYQRDRLMVFLSPNVDPLGAGYTIIQSKIAIGSGSWLGKGWLSGTQNQLNFLPERHTDFIFSVVGEEWGFAGVLILILLYFWLVRKLFQILRQTHDPYARLLATGIVTMLVIHIFVNIGMACGIMPVVGLPLPLVSYGGSNLFTTMVGLGLVVNIQLRQ